MHTPYSASAVSVRLLRYRPVLTLLTRRAEYAAAFFLLADHLQDAVNVCLNQIKDLQLAIAITRVYEGDNGPTLRRLLENEVLAIAAQEGNRWLASWAFWMLKRRDMAVRALIVSFYPCSSRTGESERETDLADRLRRLFIHCWRHRHPQTT